eukprot:gene27474-4780_t
MKGWGWSNFGTSYAAQFFNILSGRFPVRIRKFVLVNAPARFPVRIRKFVLVNAPGMFPMVWRLIKPMMTADVASKFTFVTSDTLKTVVDTEHWMPEEMGGGGGHPSMDALAFIKGQYKAEGLEYPGDIDLSTYDWKAAK